MTIYIFHPEHMNWRGKYKNKLFIEASYNFDILCYKNMVTKSMISKNFKYGITQVHLIFWIFDRKELYCCPLRELINSIYVLQIGDQ